MLEVTFLGWQGWLLSTGTTRVLVDPLLVDGIGRGPAHTQQRFLFYPQRVLDLRIETCPRIDALVLSHEHEDHFNVASLARIDRGVPVILSSRSSTAARSLLADMGFSVRLGAPGERIEIGDLSLQLWTSHLDERTSDEWDTLAYLFTSTSGRESFFSNVDIPVTLQMDAALRELSGAVLCYEAMELGLRDAFAVHATSQASMHHTDAVVPFALDDAHDKLTSSRRIRPIAGQTFVLASGCVAEVRPRCEFLSVPPVAEWRAPPSFTRGVDEPFVALTEMRDPSDAELDEIEAGLAEIAGYLYDTRLRRRLYSQSNDTLGGRQPTFVWLLCTNDKKSAYAYAYRPEACAFELVKEIYNPTDEYAGTVVSWAIDLLGLVRGEFEPRCIARAITESWHGDLAGTSVFREVLWMFFHPLRHPARCLARYRAVLAEHAAVAPVFLRA